MPATSSGVLASREGKGGTDPGQPLLSAEHLTKRFSERRNVWGKTVQWLTAVDDVSLTVFEGETLGLVGESGCGKSTVGRLLLRLIEPTSGTICFDGKVLTNLSGRKMRAMRKSMQIVFQDPYTSLNPSMSVGGALKEAVALRARLTKAPFRESEIGELLERVGLRAAHQHRYPHEFSGGQRQRVGIARALAMHPRFVVADEPVSALDVSVQAQITNLFLDLQQELGLAYLFISHDLHVVRHLSHRVAVMFAGRIVESAETSQLFTHPSHPYTETLLRAAPSLDIREGRSLAHVMPPPPPQQGSPQQGSRGLVPGMTNPQRAAQQDAPHAARRGIGGEKGGSEGGNEADGGEGYRESMLIEAATDTGLDAASERSANAQSGQHLQGCPYVSRCPRATADPCQTQRPPLVTLRPGHEVACHHPL